MKNKLIIISASGLLLAALLVFAAVQFTNVSSSESITESEAREIIKDRYQGEILNLKKVNSTYLIEMKRDQGFYQIKLSEKRGEILSFEKKDQISNAEQKQLDEEKIKEIIQAEENGELLSLKKVTQKEKSAFEAIVQKDEEKIKITVDALNGEILSRVAEENKGPVKNLTEEEAVQIALKNEPGEVDDISFGETDKGPYYLVEIEKDDGSEAAVEIHAITGKVLSVTWDD
ncbi:putative membrane protein YkoI [Cytobacillus firmus]|uniref:Putative membrane protein YkoI n=2 Tax=Cytobacillus TaxID=2675230 RepID=A0A366JTW0_CYTFI|nr:MULTISPECIES: PepSY domain-containing protein [Cytobacillus]RBP92398.1 putative membrane protein YkoI [Cytobacillus firmus]TDX41917.1 putative membrane protein YkoI [Cytobacillus oceanisediminis]